MIKKSEESNLTEVKMLALMLKRIATVTLIFHTLTVYGQGNSTTGPMFPEKFFSRMEITGGPSISKPRVDQSLRPGEGSKWVFAFNAALVHDITDKLSIVTKAGYERKGFLFESSSSSPSNIRGVLDDSFNFITLTLLARYNVWNKLNVGIGPYTAFAVSGRHKTRAYENGQLVAQSNTKIDPSTFVERWDAGASISVGYCTRLRDDLSITFQLGYNIGLVDMNKNPDLPMYHRTLVGSVGIIVPSILKSSRLTSK